MQHLDEGTIHAWLDGELAADEASEISSHLSDCPECAAMVAEARGLVAAATRILTALDDVPAGVLPGSPEKPPGPVMRRRWYQRTDIRAAAALLFVAGGSLLVLRRSEDAAVSPQATMAVERTGVADTGDASLGKAEPAAAPTADKLATSNAPFAAVPMRGRVPSPAAAPRIADRAVAPAPVNVAAKASSPAAIVGESNRLMSSSPAGTLGALSGSAANVAVADEIAAAPLRVLRVDSSTATKQTVYEVAPGVQVTLAEMPVETAMEKSLGVREPARRAATMVPQRPPAESDRKTADSAAGGEVRGAVGGALGGLQTQRSATARVNATGLARAVPAAVQLPVKTITWIDNGRRYTLAGPLTEAQLELLKPRVMKLVRR